MDCLISYSCFGFCLVDDTIDGKGKHAHHGFTTMGYDIHYHEAWPGFTSIVGLNGYLFSQQGSGFGGGAASFTVLYSVGA
jgi:hypothetical protein